MMKCHKCIEVFENKTQLMKHWRNKTPCDFVCKLCGLRLQSRRAYQQHIKKGEECKYRPSELALEKAFLTNMINPM